MATQTLIQVGATTVDASAVTTPANRTFRGAWNLNGPVIEVDMPTARNIWRNKLRTERAKLLTALDAEWFLAAETNNTVEQARIAAAKQKLRDVTSDPRIESSTTPEELEALTLKVLVG